MAKKKQKKSKSTAKPMAIDAVDESHVSIAMDTSEGSAGAITIPASRSLSGVKKKKAPQRRAQRLRKEKAVEKALSSMDKQEEKVQKFQFKSSRILSVKGLY